MSLSHRIIGEMPYKALQKQCFLWERGASVGVTLNFQDPSHAHNLYKHNKGKENSQNKITGVL